MILALALAALGPERAYAQSDREVKAYEAHVDAGTRHFRASRFARARAEFQKAYAIHPEPTLLFNIASTYRRQGQNSEALEHYRRFLNEAPADHPQRKRAEATVTDLEAEAVLNGEDVAATDDPGDAPDVDATPAADSGPDALADADTEPDLAPEPASEDEAGATAEAELSTTQRAEPSLGPGAWWKIGGAASMAGGVLLLVGAGIEGRRASSREGELEGEPGGDWTPYLMETYEEGESAEKRAIIFGVSGAVLLGAGAALYWIGHGKAREAGGGTTIGALGGSDRVGVALSGSF